MDGEGEASSTDDTWTYKGRWLNGAFHGRGKISRKKTVFKTTDLSTGILSITNTSYEYTGDFKAGLESGEGSASFPMSNQSHTGQWENGKMNGKGTMHQGKLFYTGVFEDNYLHGKGEVERSNHSYKGDFKKGVYHGTGELVMTNKDRYTGGFENGMFHGIGTWYQEETSDSYKGEWTKGMKYGEGIEIKYGDYHYSGRFKDGLRDGYGTIKFTNGDTYVGGFLNGLYHSEGHLTFSNGSSYKGFFHLGKRHGTGEEQLPSGATYKGTYEDDMWKGKGILTHTNSDRYEGEFLNGKKNGTGMLYFAEGSRLSCNWVDDVLHGQGEYHYAYESSPPTIRTYHQGTLVEEGLSASVSILDPPVAPSTLSPEKSVSLGSVRTKTAVESDHKEALHTLTEQMSDLQEQLTDTNLTPSQSFALKKKIAVVRSQLLKEERGYKSAIKSY
eukprot:TRINITY_DN2403_c1_g1_i1.p1 TRINITY_DN2403_c1_g1~~TRINITY_DN2403_c1_g1_i1.p1  ORF type:complete len:443 (+),score=90.85 TRINITY_DN2403_c1_g1_i1:841-2169(+)